MGGNNQVLRLLLDQNADPNAGDSPPLHNACSLRRKPFSEFPETVQMLLKAKADPLRVNQYKQTPLDIAVYTMRSSIKVYQSEDGKSRGDQAIRPLARVLSLLHNAVDDRAAGNERAAAEESPSSNEEV